MKVSLPFLLQIQGAAVEGEDLTPQAQESTDLPGKRLSLGGWVALTFQQVVASLMTGYHTEHHDDDTHADIHCDSISERSRDVAMGVWKTALTADASAFTGSGAMTWTVDIGDQANSYTLIGTTMILTVRIDTSSVGGVPNNILAMRIPDGFHAVRAGSGTCLIYDNTLATAVLGQMRVLTSAPTVVQFLRFDGANFAASANNTAVVGQLAIEVQS